MLDGTKTAAGAAAHKKSVLLRGWISLVQSSQIFVSQIQLEKENNSGPQIP